MVTVSFLGGVNVVGSSKVLVEEKGWRLLFDLGLDRPAGNLYHNPIAPRHGMELSDRLRVGEAPRIPHLFRESAVKETGLVGGSDGKTAVFITHAHVDHIGLTGWVDPRVPIYAAPETVRVREGLERLKEAHEKNPQLELIHAEKVMLEGEKPQLISMETGVVLKFGPFDIIRYPVDHDVPGASGYIVKTRDGMLAYTGDIRLHGRHADWVKTFAEAARGAQMLVIEGTSLGSQNRDVSHPATEASVDAKFDEILGKTKGLALLSVRPRNVERNEAFMRIAQKHGRHLLWSEEFAIFHKGYGVADVECMRYTPEEIDKVRAHPERYIIQIWPHQWPWLLDLPVNEDSVFIYADGDPSKSSQSGWKSLQNWLKLFGIPLRIIGTRGHASPEALQQIVEWVQPDVVVPLHTHAAELLEPDPPTVRIIPKFAKKY
ncbi:MAG: MBL fold metallo-hydrolase, partial [Firmicutes bacterium]|nr:MBL fold metallo-hydrolase [Bacillota bacterium]